jgi:RecA/RadA recombinase
MANTALAELSSRLSDRFEVPTGFRQRQVRDPFDTGIAALDRLLPGGFPRASLSEVCGGPSSSRTALVMATLTRALAAGECGAWIDAAAMFDPASAADAGVALERLLWINCGGQAEYALKAADLLLHGGGFGLMVFDLADLPDATVRRISLASWFRLRHAAEQTGTALILITSSPQTRSCSAVHVELHRQKSLWRGRLLRGIRSLFQVRRHGRSEGVAVETVV